MKYSFKVDHFSFLGADGNLIKELPTFASDPAELVRMYKYMVMTRALDQEAIRMYKAEQIGTYASTLGEEAVDVGVGCALLETPGNVFAPYYRNHGTLLAVKGEQSFLSTLLFWGGDERGNLLADRESLLPFAVPIGTQFPISTGVAKGRRLLKKAGAIVVTGGDGSTSKGDFSSSLNEAATKKLPVVFVIKNNQWAISMPVAEQTATHPLALRGSGYAMPSSTVDGNDVIAVRHAVTLAIARARSGGGPSLIEAQTYRLADHTTVDQAKQYRDEEDVNRAREREPLIRLRKFLINHEWWGDAKESALNEDAKRTAEEMRKAYLSYPRQATADLVKYLFEHVPDVASYREQLAEIIKKGA